MFTMLAASTPISKQPQPRIVGWWPPDATSPPAAVFLQLLKRVKDLNKCEAVSKQT